MRRESLQDPNLRSACQGWWFNRARGSSSGGFPDLERCRQNISSNYLTNRWQGHDKPSIRPL